jgi:hypothetical protein
MLRFFRFNLLITGNANGNIAYKNTSTEMDQLPALFHKENKLGNQACRIIKSVNIRIMLLKYPHASVLP